MAKPTKFYSDATGEGNIIGIVSTTAMTLLSAAVWAYQVRENRIRERGGRDYRLDGLSDDEIAMLGHKHPSRSTIFCSQARYLLPVTSAHNITSICRVPIHTLRREGLLLLDDGKVDQRLDDESMEVSGSFGVFCRRLKHLFGCRWRIYNTKVSGCRATGRIDLPESLSTATSAQWPSFLLPRLSRTYPASQ